MLRNVFAILVIVHGLIHIMGFVKSFSPSTITRLAREIPEPVGVLWLVAAVLFISAGILLFIKYPCWWVPAGSAIVLSQVLIVMSWGDAKAGTALNVVVLLGVVVGYGTWSFDSLVEKELAHFLSYSRQRNSEAGEVVTERRLSTLPSPVRRWLDRTGVVGKREVYSVHLKQRGEMRTSPEGKWMSVEAEQWFRVDEPAFIWVADVSAAPGIHLYGKDTFIGGRGCMLIKLLSLITVADARGEETDQGAMLRFLAETVWFPTAAVAEYIRWEEIDSTYARAFMKLGTREVSGVFTFSPDGDVAGFEAKRYYTRKNGASLEDWYIRMDPGGYREFGGVRIPARAEVIWKLREGDFPWFRLEVTDMEYDSSGVLSNKMEL